MNNSMLPSGMPSYGIGDFIQALFRNKKKVVYVPIAILSLAAMAIWLAPREYRSEAKLFMQVGRESVKIDGTATTGDTISMQSNSREGEIITAMEAFKSRGTIEKVVDKLGADVVLGKGGLGEEPLNLLVRALRWGVGVPIRLVRSIDPVSDRERAIILIERNLGVYAENDSTLITASYDADSPELAQLVTQTLIDVYRNEHLRLHRTVGSKQFFAQQHDALKQQLDETMEKLRAAKNRMNIVSIESRRKTLEERMANTELSLYSNLQQLASTRAQVADLHKQLANTPARMIAQETTVPNTGTDLLREQVFALQVLMLDQQSKYSEDHPSLQVTREQLEEAQAMLKAESVDRLETTNDSNPNHHALALSLAQEDSVLAGIVAQNNELNEQRSTVVADLKNLNDHELEMDQLERASQLARSNYFRYAEKLEKARIDEELDKNAISNAIKAQEATFAEKPVSPSKLLIGTLAMMLSFASVVSLVLISENISHSIYKEEQLEESLQLPVFGVVPEHQQRMKSIT
ncbi:MAG: hypothetical protein GXP24_11165 [Planctomycetes bacterium]|nr:hypothetical protein [Planctomycetota bacterium]